MRSHIIVGMCLLFLVQYFIGAQWLAYALACLALFSFFSSVSLAKRGPRMIGLLMFTAGALLTVCKGDGLALAAQGITTNLPLLTLLVLVPLLAIPLKMGGFFESLFVYLRRFQNRPRKMFAGMTVALFFLGPILNLGALRIVHDLIKDLRLNATLLSKAYLIGFFSTILWSPYYAAVGITLMYLKVSVTDYMVYGFGIAALFLLIGNVLFWFWSRKLPIANAMEEAPPTTGEQRRKLQLLIGIVCLLMIITIALEWLTHWSMLVIVSLVALTFPLVWGLVSRNWVSLKHHLIQFRDDSVPVMNNEIMMYISAGFFGQALRGTSFGEGINGFMVSLGQRSYVWLALFILVTMVSVTFLGIHQVVTVTVLTTQMDPVLLGTSKEILAMTIMLAWATASILSPVNPINLLVSGFTHRSGLQVGIRDNGFFLMIVCFVGLAILTILTYT
ncbi:hypothetical protein BEP19_08705 [Ammoniphilus oxalaticus]|uniref:Citrate transporter-like domain-containing protein n=1 Tax=Ammoniphilus oxalaticus TaxID=66863 RepID=A0A419SKF1_9BACL|nr:hypothetical protein [Ammoniphilus oxalaticus]RKD24457.1 hypothetical protein BEP19_08705 [Ammoniphilus oxalaticus]